MRLLVESEIKPVGGIVGAGFDELRWPRPVRPGDELRVESEVLEVRPSKSRPEQGIIKVRTTTLIRTARPCRYLSAISWSRAARLSNLRPTSLATNQRVVGLNLVQRLVAL
jgi:hypothetical protein